MTKELKVYFNFIKLIYRQSRLFIGSKIFLAIIQGVFPVFNVIIPKYMIDSILELNNYNFFLFYVVLYIIINIVINLVYTIINIYVNHTLIKIDSHITCETLDKLYRMSFEIYEDTDNYNVITRAFQFASGAGINSFDLILKTFATLITTVSYLYIIATYNIIVILIIFIGIFINFMIKQKQTKLNFLFKNKVTLVQRKIEYFKNILLNKDLAKDIRISGGYHVVKKNYTEHLTFYSREVLSKEIKLFRNEQLGNIFQNIITMTIMIYFGTMLYNKQLSVGEYTVSLNASMQFNGIIFSLIGSVSSLYGSILESKNYAEFLKITDNSDGKENKPFTCTNEISIFFDNVSFGYKEGHTVLKNFTFRFNNNNMYAILGHNGSGKSTIIKLILGLYRPQEGNIYINNVNINNIDLYVLYTYVSIVFQDFQLIEGITIKENLCLDKNYDDNISKYIHEFSLEHRFNNKNNTIENIFSKRFDKNGIELSGGEKQKLVLIRALYKQTPIVLLDEPTSAMDSVSEVKFFNDISKIKKNKLVIYVTHNADMAKKADMILFIQNGKLIENGTYNQLNQPNTNFYNFFIEQQI